MQEFEPSSSSGLQDDKGFLGIRLVWTCSKAPGLRCDGSHNRLCRTASFTQEECYIMQQLLRQPSPITLAASSHSPIKGVALNCLKINIPTGLRNHSSFVYTSNKSPDPQRPPWQPPEWNHKWCQIQFYTFFFPQFIFHFGLHLTHSMMISLSLHHNHNESVPPVVYVIIKTGPRVILTTSLALKPAPKKISKTSAQNTPLCNSISSEIIPRVMKERK